MLLTIEVVGGVLLSAFLIFLAITFVRRRLIGHGAHVAVAGLRLDADARWRLGLLRLDDSGMQWYPLLGVTTIPARGWVRTTLDLSPASRMDPEGPLVALRDRVVKVPAYGVTVAGEGTHFEIALSPAPYTALRAWVEASPPSGWPVH